MHSSGHAWSSVWKGFWYKRHGRGRASRCLHQASATIVVSRIIRGPNVMEMCPMTLAQVRANHGAVHGALAEPSAGLWWRRGLRVHPSSSPSKNDGYNTSNCNVGSVSDVRFNIHVIDSKCGQDDLKRRSCSKRSSQNFSNVAVQWALRRMLQNAVGFFDHDRASHPEIVVCTLQLRDGGFRGQKPEGVIGQMLLAKAACSCFFRRIVCQR